MIFEDCDDGVSLSITSDPPFPERENLSRQDEDLTEAQHLALAMAHKMNEVAQEQDDSHQGHPKCRRHTESDGACSRHKDTEPHKCCKKH